MRFLVLLWLLLLAGCARMHQSGPEAMNGRYQVAEAALLHMLDFYDGSSGRGSSLHVLRPGVEFGPRLLESLSDKGLVTGIEIAIENGEMVDPVTCRRVHLWSVKVLEMRGGHAVAVVSRYLAEAWFNRWTGNTLHLRRKQGLWIVESVEINYGAPEFESNGPTPVISEGRAWD